MTVLDSPRLSRFRTFWDSAQAVLQETGVFRAKESDDSAAVTGSRVNLPQWLFLYLVAQLVGAIWWAASLQSDVRYLQAETAKLWQKVEVITMQQADTDKRFDKRVRDEVRDAMQDAGFLRVRP